MYITELTPSGKKHYITMNEGEQIHINAQVYAFECGKLNELEEGVKSGWVTKADGTVFMSTADKHNRVTSELHDIWKKKNADYGNSFKDLREEYPESILIRIGDKYNRLKTLFKQKEQVKDESLEDTLKDLANYCIMELIERQESKDTSEVKKPTTDDMEEFWEEK